TAGDTQDNRIQRVAGVRQLARNRRAAATAEQEIEERGNVLEELYNRLNWDREPLGAAKINIRPGLKETLQKVLVLLLDQAQITLAAAGALAAGLAGLRERAHDLRVIELAGPL